MPNARIAVLALTASALAASGCGGTTKSSSQPAPAAQTQPQTQTSAATQASTPTQPLTRAELLTQADTICRRVNAKRASVTITTRADYARVLPPIGTYELAAASAMHNLTPPRSMARAWRKIVANARALGAANIKIGESAKVNDFKIMRSLDARVSKASEELLATAKREGFADCART